MDFRKLMSPQQRADFDQRTARLKADNEKFAALSNRSLAMHLAYYMNNSTRPRFQPGDCVYDASLWFSILPEIFKRLLGDDSIESIEQVTQSVFTQSLEGH